MIGRLRGIVVERGLDGVCILEAGGVGYEVSVPLSTLPRLPSTEVVFHVHTHVREDALTLFGFLTPEDRAAFRVLLSVSSVGPKIALSILGALDANELATAIARGDRNAFKGISGVGKKIVERLVLELKDKLIASGTATLTSPVHPPQPGDGKLGIITGALVQMGYKPAEAERAVAKIANEAEDKTPEVLLREALTHLS